MDELDGSRRGAAAELVQGAGIAERDRDADLDVVALRNGPLLRVVDALPVPEGWPLVPVLVEGEPD